ncbi:MAG TPA: hypothetical protein VFD70_25490 [Anaerolineae bacterium]|nr:hypothetical protein [Anaerolineae bacterium]
MNLGNGNSKWVFLIGGIVLFAICAFLLLGGNFLKGNQNISPVTQPNTSATNAALNQPASSDVQLGQLVTARQIGTGNRPTNVTNQFSQSDPVIYAVVQGLVIPQGTHIFARWSRNGSPFEDTNEIIANQTYQNTYVEFHIAPTDVALTPGTYTVQLFINGNPGPQAQFTVS